MWILQFPEKVIETKTKQKTSKINISLYFDINLNSGV